ncbi:hypothetical protein HMF8227_02134 [Saliniradius amylolyticus]|uniref:PNPLA domain-containing protein n=1 Tax=Saliniradius amylolyticus TaxID=2183582 RepID=A0A2S2E4Z4_9ALTE|nr:patatin-like phospholipase family protein [Saliniradius amylolyticus]AWL12592.1 hypothetical protein HMF8227_02134 [Saliniradius amylolyticus]
MIQRNQFALLLSGGGARAAYQVGVLKAITELLPRNHPIPFPVICGTSAGAINATAMACFASCYHLGVRKLEWVWKNFHTEQVYQSHLLPVFGHLLGNQLQNWRSDQVPRHPSSLLNNQPLRELLHQTLDFSRIDRNILRRQLRAICVTASSYAHKESFSFFQGASDLEPWHRAQRRGVKATLYTEHLMASAAIPLVFPTIRLHEDYFGDGSIHQLSPLSAPIHLGAERILVVGVEQPQSAPNIKSGHPSSAMIAGHLLDTIFADTLHSDLERLYRINHTLSLLSHKERQQTQLKRVECLVINPTVNLNAIASDYYQSLPMGIRALMKLLGIKPDKESSLLSYLLFEGAFCQQLINIGYRDGVNRRDEIRQFLEL